MTIVPFTTAAIVVFVVVLSEPAASVLSPEPLDRICPQSQ